jgi:spermidine/putrescine-binding protein
VFQSYALFPHMTVEAQCACRVVQDYYSDNEEMLAKLAAGASGYDLIVRAGNVVESLIRQNALRPLDKTSYPICTTSTRRISMRKKPAENSATSPASPKKARCWRWIRWCCTRAARVPTLAHRFINFMLDGHNAAELTNLIGSGNPNRDALQYINPEIAQNPAVFPDRSTSAAGNAARSGPPSTPRAVAHLDQNRTGMIATRAS